MSITECDHHFIIVSQIQFSSHSNIQLFSVEHHNLETTDTDDCKIVNTVNIQIIGYHIHVINVGLHRQSLPTGTLSDITS